MPDCLSYALFGYGESYKDSFPFKSYLRNFGLNLRVAKLLNPEYKVCLSIDGVTYDSPYRDYFTGHANQGAVDLNIVNDRLPLCAMMLQRLNPIFSGKYERVLCKDADSLLCYRERQAALYWNNVNRVGLAVTDSISHNVPLMGGMIGLKSLDIRLLFNVSEFSQLMALGSGIDFSRKGSDQDFLNKIILPRIADSLTEFYVKGMPNSFRADYHNTIPDLEEGPAWLKETDNLGWHIGASGFQVDGTVKWLRENEPTIDSEYFDEAERKFTDTFYWHL